VPFLPLPVPVTDVIPARRLTTLPVVDGRIDPAEWADAAAVEGPLYDEQNGAAGAEKNRFWIGYDDRFIYFAAQLTDAEPNRIRATAFRPNVSLFGDDFVGLYIDPFGTFNDGNNFEVNSAGATNIRVNGGRAAKREWLGEIDAKARRTPEGWEAEARVPWSVIRLPEAGARDLRINFYRYFSRTQRSFTLANIANGQVAQTPVWKAVEVPKLETRRPVKLLPYAYGGYEDGKGVILNSGLDLKYGVTPDLDLIGSVNPDFRNIENQVLSVDFSYFERLAGETRPFFLEGADYFRTSGDAPLFAPQRIMSFDTGAKMYGKIGPRTQAAVLNTVDFGNENALVGSLRQNFGPRKDLRVAATQLDRPGLSNSASFIAAEYGLGKFDFFGQYQSTEDSEEGAGHRTNVGYFASDKGWFGLTEWVDVSPNFLPRLGFAPRRGYRGFSGFVGYETPILKGPIQQWSFNLGAVDWKTYAGNNFTTGANGSFSLTTKSGIDFDFGYDATSFRENKDHLTFFDVTYPNGDPYRNVGVGISSGRIAGEDYLSLSPRITLRPTNRIGISASFQEVRHTEISSQAFLTVNYDMNVSDTIAGRFLQQGSRTSWYLSYRRAGNRGAEYYLILGEPNVDFERSFRASLILKAVFPIDWRI
jgi:hypothetical protein